MQPALFFRRHFIVIFPSFHIFYIKIPGLWEHEFYGKSLGAIDVGNGKHVHFIKDFTKEEDNHKHEFQAATLIDSPIDFKCK